MPQRDSRRSPPLREGDVADLVRGVRAAPLLFGYRGSDPVDVEALEDVVARVSALADDLLRNWDRALEHFWQVCPKEMVGRLDHPLEAEEAAFERA